MLKTNNKFIALFYLCDQCVVYAVNKNGVRKLVANEKDIDECAGYFEIFAD